MDKKARPGRVLFSAEDIRRRVADLAAQITRDYRGKPLTVVAVLKGSVRFLHDLLAHLGHEVTVELIQASSYGDATTSSGQVAIQSYADLKVKGRDVLVVDDIADTGLTLHSIVEHLERCGARSVRTCVLLDKPARRRVPLQPDYRGFTVEDVFVVGYGLDHAGRFRDLPHIAELRPDGAEDL